MAVRLNGTKVRETREKRGLTINALAAQMGVSRWTVSRTERGLTGIGEDNAEQLAYFLGVQVKDLK